MTDKTPPPITFTTKPKTALPLPLIKELHQAGYDAAWKGQPPTTCPYRYSPEKPDAPYQRDHANAWLAGHAAALTDMRFHRHGTPPKERNKHPRPGTL